MLERKPDFLDLPHQFQRENALSRSESKGVAAPDHQQEGSIPGEVQTDAPPLTNAELVQLHIRVIALENLVIALLQRRLIGSSSLLAKWQPILLRGQGSLAII